MKRILAIIVIVFLMLILYVETTSFTNTTYWASRQPANQGIFSAFIKGASSNASAVTAWNAFVSFVPNIFHTLNGIKYNVRRNISNYRVGLRERDWNIYKDGLDQDYDTALTEVANYLEDLEKKVNWYERTDAQLLGEGITMSDKAKEILHNYYGLAKARQQAFKDIIESGIYAQERSKLWDGIKIHPDYGREEDSIFTKSSKFIAQCFVYIGLIIIIIVLIPIALGSEKKLNLLKKISESKAYQLVKGCFYWSTWRVIVSVLMFICVGLFFWAALSSTHPDPQTRIKLPFVGLLWGCAAGLLSYIILLIFSPKTYNLIRTFFKWKHWKWVTSIIIALGICLLLSFGLSASDFKPEARLFFPVIVLAVGILNGIISFLVLCIISFVVKKIILFKKNSSKHKKSKESIELEELKKEKEQLQNQILSLEVAELKKKLSDLENKQEK